MGNVNFTYRASRGAAKPGDPIHSARDAFQMLIEHELENLQALYANANEEDKEAIDRAFDGEAEDKLSSQASAEGWLNEVGDDVLEECLAAVKPVLSK